MAKVWKDANEAIKMIHELEDSKLRELDIEMRKKHLSLISVKIREKNIIRSIIIYLEGRRGYI